jgi:hypothetical protein
MGWQRRAAAPLHMCDGIGDLDSRFRRPLLGYRLWRQNCSRNERCGLIVRRYGARARVGGPADFRGLNATVATRRYGGRARVGGPADFRGLNATVATRRDRTGSGLPAEDLHAGLLRADRLFAGNDRVRVWLWRSIVRRLRGSRPRLRCSHGGRERRRLRID